MTNPFPFSTGTTGLMAVAVAVALNSVVVGGGGWNFIESDFNVFTESIGSHSQSTGWQISNFYPLASKTSVPTIFIFLLPQNLYHLF